MGEMKIDDMINSALVTEVIAIRVGMAFFGVPPVACGTSLRVASLPSFDPKSFLAKVGEGRSIGPAASISLAASSSA
jgi:hypothetical protein